MFKVLAAAAAAYLVLFVAIPMATNGLVAAMNSAVQGTATSTARYIPMDAASVGEIVAHCTTADCVDAALRGDKGGAK